jgi:hypothetical protein
VFANAPTLVLPNVDVINEATPGVGVTVDGVVLKDNDVDADSVLADDVSAPILNATGTSSSGGIVRLYEDTDNGTNYIELKAPSSLSANRLFTLPDDDGSVQQFLRTDGSGALSFASALVSGTMLTASTQTELAFTDIPAWVKKITISYAGLSTNGTSVSVLLQLGDSGGYETTSYATGLLQAASGGNSMLGSATNGMYVSFNNTTLYVLDGVFTLALIDAATNTWAGAGSATARGTNAVYVTSGSKTLSATLDRLRLYVDGTVQFDAGTVNILYE